MRGVRSLFFMRETIRNMGVWRKCLKMANNAVSWSGQKWEESVDRIPGLATICYNATS